MFLYLFFFVERTSKGTSWIESKVAVERKSVETRIETSISILNAMVDAIHEITSESDIHQIYESITEYIQENKEVAEIGQFHNLLKKLDEKMKIYSKLKGRNQAKVLATYYKFCLRIRGMLNAHGAT